MIVRIICVRDERKERWNASAVAALQFTLWVVKDDRDEGCLCGHNARVLHRGVSTQRVTVVPFAQLALHRPDGSDRRTASCGVVALTALLSAHYNSVPDCVGVRLHGADDDEHTHGSIVHFIVQCGLISRPTRPSADTRSLKPTQQCGGSCKRGW